MTQPRASRFSFSRLVRRKGKPEAVASHNARNARENAALPVVVVSGMSASAPSLASNSQFAISEIKGPRMSMAAIPTIPETSDAPGSSHLALDDSTPASIHSVDQEADLSRDLWVVAYQNLRTEESTAKLMEVYERILTGIYSQKDESDILRLGESARNMLDSSGDPRERVARMTEMTQVFLEKAKRHQNVHENVRQTITFVQATASVVGNMLVVYPPVSLGCAGICAILPMAHPQAVARDALNAMALRDGLFYVMEKMEWYMTLSQESLDRSTTTGLTGLIRARTITLLESLLEYEAKAVCFLYGKSPLTQAIMSVFSVSWEMELKDVKSRETEVRDCISQATGTAAASALSQISQDTANLTKLLDEMRNMREQGHEEKERQATARRLELVGRFSTETTCPYLERMMAVPKRVDGTCEWFQTHEKYRDWLSSRDGGLLLLSADPGCGKSVLSRFLVEEVFPIRLPAKTATLSYFFFKDSPDQNNVPAALCALIHQILTQRPDMTDRVQNDIIESGAALTLKERVLWKILGKLVSAHGSSDLVLVLDALDECQKEGRLSLLEHLQKLLEHNSSTNAKPGETRNGKVRLLVTSRGYPEIIKLFDRFSRGCIHLAGENKAEIDQIQDEIEMVVNYRLDRLAEDRKLSDKRKEALRQTFLRKGGEQRTYLWVRLVLEVLESNLRDQLHVWKAMINTLPQTVYDTYEKLLGNVRDADRDRVMTLLRLMIAAFRPLPLRTAILLLNARDFADNEDALDEAEEEEVEWESETSFRAWVLETCGIFITIYDQRLFFIHQTAKEFLQAPDKSQPTAPTNTPKTSGTVLPTTFRHSISASSAHKVMAEACIALWTYGDKPTEKWEKDERYRYPLELWAQHFRDAQVFSAGPHGEGGDAQLVGDVDARFWDAYLALWHDATFIRAQLLSELLAKNDATTYRRREFTDEVRLAYIATYGHYRLLQSELDRLAGTGKLDMIPLLFSAQGVAKECAQLLLRHLPMRPVVVISDYS